VYPDLNPEHFYKVPSLWIPDKICQKRTHHWRLSESVFKSQAAFFRCFNLKSLAEKELPKAFLELERNFYEAKKLES
jgi:hypothetical protein